MSVQVHDTSCRNCGWTPPNLGETHCKFCKGTILVSTFNSVASMPSPMIKQYADSYKEALKNEPDAEDLNNSVAMCYLKLELHEEALSAFKKAIERDFDNSETYFYAAICLLKGKKAFMAQRSDIDQIEKYIKAALKIEPNKGIFHYFWAYIKYDFFERKSLNTTPTYQELLSKAHLSGLPGHDIDQLFQILNVSRPDVL